jgi:hypothetical protein
VPGGRLAVLGAMNPSQTWNSRSYIGQRTLVSCSSLLFFLLINTIFVPVSPRELKEKRLGFYTVKEEIQV